MPELSYTKSNSPNRLSQPVRWTVFQTQLALLDEWFNVSYFRDCLEIAEVVAPIHKVFAEGFGRVQGRDADLVRRAVAKIEDTNRWATETRRQDYHRVHVGGLVALWAAQESGIENLVAVLIKTDKTAALMAISKFRENRYSADLWPWDEQTCLEISQKLDLRAKKELAVDGTYAYLRLQLLLSWFDLHIILEPSDADAFDEAAYVRNLIMHRYGVLAPKDVQRFPNFKKHQDEVLPVTSEMLQKYYTTINKAYIEISGVVNSSRYF